jgi:hypothetical protein
MDNGKYQTVKAVQVVTVCGHCGESVEIFFTKPQLKRLLKKLKLKPTMRINVPEETLRNVKEGMKE